MLKRPIVLPRVTPGVAALAVAVVHGGYVALTGVRWAGDSAAYAFWADRLIVSGFDYPLLLAEASPSFPAIFYALFVTLAAGLRLSVGDDWPVALVVLNFACHVGLAALVVRLAVLATGAAAGSWAALFLFLACHDLVRWAPFILSDSTFAFLAFATFSLAAGWILDPGKSWVPVAVPAVAGVFYRPTGIVLLADLAWAAFLARRKRLPSPRVLAGSIAVGALGGAILFAWLVAAPGRWPFATFSSAFEAVASGYAVGEVVSARPETAHAAPAGVSDILLISADRFLHFFAIGADGHSAVHWAVSLAFFLPAYAFAGWLCIALWRGDSGLGETQRRLFLASAGAVLAYAGFHALVQVDFDWRYRLPVLPHLVLLAAGGAADLARRVRRG